MLKSEGCVGSGGLCSLTCACFWSWILQVWASCEQLPGRNAVNMDQCIVRFEKKIHGVDKSEQI